MSQKTFKPKYPISKRAIGRIVQQKRWKAKNKELAEKQRLERIRAYESGQSLVELNTIQTKEKRSEYGKKHRKRNS